MSSKLMVNLIDPSEIVIPDTDGGGSNGAVTPDTGIFSIGQNAGDAQNNSVFIIAAIGLVILLAIVAVLLVRRYKKRSAVYGPSSTYAPMKLGAQKHLIPKLAGLSFIILVSVFGILKFNDNQRMASAEAVDGPSLTVTTEDITAIDIEMEDEAVFGVGESKVKVTTATDTGYTLMAYVDSTSADLTNDSNDAITMLETSQSQALTDNTWGIALSRPNSQDEIKFRGLPTAEKDAMVVKVSGSDATEANDETTLYYGAYVTPDLDYGTYEGVTINYIAVAHVTDGDVTVNFHGNGYYFDQAGTKDVNTVVYGTSCELAYVGGNCSKVYTTEQPEIVKTPNIRDDGTQNGPYEIPSQTKVGMASIPGADYLRIELIYNLDGGVIIAQGNESLINKPAVFEEFYMQGETTYLVNGDTASFGMFANSPGEGYDYGFYAKVYPIFYQKPENIETIENTSCHFAKSDNLDDDGNMIEPYGERYTQSVTLPGASKIKIEIEYALTDEAWIRIFEGQIINNSGPIMIIASPVYEITTWDEESDTGSNISGRETIVVDGDALTFVMRAYDPPVSGYNYGFYARLYPIYDEEKEDTIPEQACSFTNKSGEYSLPVGYGNDGPILPKRIWYDVIDDDGYLISGKGFRDEDELKSTITNYYDEFAGKTIDLYLFNDYSIRYDSNDGNGNTDDQWVSPHTNATIYYNRFTNSGYEFIGWNTRSDGTGTWYQPDDVVLDLAQPGETITLYAQWEITYSGTIEYYPNANGVTDTMGTQYIPISTNSVVLWVSNFKRPGYGFAGWSDKNNWALGENDINGNGTGANAGYHIYGPNQTISFITNQYLATPLLLYAVWVPSAGNLQNWTCPDDDNMPIGSVTALTDLRDNDTYAIAKLADGKCWMIENLRLDSDADFTPSLSQGFGGAFVGLANSESYFNESVTQNSLYKYDGSGDIIGINGATRSDIGLDNDPGYRMPRYYNTNTSSNTNVTDMTSPNQQVYGYGNYYSWAAAKANTNYLDKEGSEMANTSVCPAGWHLPTGGVPGEFYELNISLGGPVAEEDATYVTWSRHTFGGFPNNFVDSGYVGGASVNSRGGSGEYWSSSSSPESTCGARCAYNFWFDSDSSTIFIHTSSKDFMGAAIRCIAD